MSIVTDTLMTIAVLDDSKYIAGADRMARQTEKIGGNGNVLSNLSMGLTVAGGLLVGLESKAIKAASQFQQLNRSMETLYGKSAGDKIFSDIKQFTFSTPYTAADWASNAQMLGGFKVAAQDLIPTLKDLGDATTAGNGVDVEKLKQAAFAFGEMNIGFANSRHVNMFQRAHIDAIGYLEKYMGLSEQQVANIGKMHIPGKYVDAALRVGIEEDPTRHDAQLKFMKTLKGEASNLNDAWNQFLANAGTGALAPVSHAMHALADELKKLSNPNASGALGWGMLIGGPALLATAPIMRAIGLWQQMRTAKNMAAVAANTEKDAEIAKLPILETENATLPAVTGKWASLGTSLLGVAKAAVVLYGAYAALNFIMGAFKAHTAPGRDDLTYDADWNNLYNKDRAGALADFAEHPGERLLGGIGAGLAGRGVGRGGWKGFTDAGSRIIAGSKDAKDMAALNKLRPELSFIDQHWNTVPWGRVQTAADQLNKLVTNARNFNPADAAFGAVQAKSENANKALLAEFMKNKGQYDKVKPGAGPLEHLDVAVDRAETMMKIAKLQKHPSEENKFRLQAISLINQQVAALTKYAASIEHAEGKGAKWLSTEKKILALMDKGAELKADKDKDKDGFDKVNATILGAGGLSEEEILKRTGIGRKNFGGLPGGHAPTNPLHALIEKASKKATVIQLHLNGKMLQEIKHETVDETLKAILTMLEHSTTGQRLGAF